MNESPADALADESGAAILGVDMPTKRSVTMSIGLINTAERVVVAASGVGKAETVRRALEEDDEMLPVSSVDAFSGGMGTSEEDAGDVHRSVER